MSLSTKTIKTGVIALLLVAAILGGYLVVACDGHCEVGHCDAHCSHTCNCAAYLVGTFLGIRQPMLWGCIDTDIPLFYSFLVDSIFHPPLV